MHITASDTNSGFWPCTRMGCPVIASSHSSHKLLHMPRKTLNKPMSCAEGNAPPPAIHQGTRHFSAIPVRTTRPNLEDARQFRCVFSVKQFADGQRQGVRRFGAGTIDCNAKREPASHGSQQPHTTREPRPRPRAGACRVTLPSPANPPAPMLQAHSCMTWRHDERQQVRTAIAAAKRRWPVVRFRQHLSLEVATRNRRYRYRGRRHSGTDARASDAHTATVATRASCPGDPSLLRLCKIWGMGL